jgi:hypothetical protein
VSKEAEKRGAAKEKKGRNMLIQTEGIAEKGLASRLAYRRCDEKLARTSLTIIQYEPSYCMRKSERANAGHERFFAEGVTEGG